MFPLGYDIQKLPIEPSLRSLVEQEKWDEVDLAFKKLSQPEGAIFKIIQQYCAFENIETMISIRDAANDWEEDGIWHDDGSRVFAFSLSLTLDASQVDGNLELRKKHTEESVLIPTPEFGTAILFLTGIHGYEHRTRRVEKGKRIMLVGWCS